MLYNNQSIVSRLDDVPDQLLIGGWRPAADGATFAVHDPASGDRLADVADGSAVDAHDALAAATMAGPAWKRTPPRQRSEVLARIYDILVERRDDLALVICAEMGKPLAEATTEVLYAADYVRWYAEEGVRIGGRTAIAPDGRSRISTAAEPVGPCLLITPWNFPLAMGARKLAPALAAGCTAVLKPSELTPLSSLMLGQIALDAGLPPGVLSIVTTTNPEAACAPLLDDPRLRKLSFTGSTAVGRRLLAQCSGQVLRTSMELGGNAPLLVFDDADLDCAVDGAVLAKLRNGGQSCVAANRLLVQEGIADAFVERFTARLAAVTVGRGTDPNVELGPLIDERAVAKVDDLVADAQGRGARLLTGGHRQGPPGHFYAPTVLDEVPRDARALHEEIFGPVAPIVRVAGEDEAVELANATRYGLAAYVFTTNLDRAARVTDALETGMVGINQGVVANVAAPFGGIKHSGLGREGGAEGLAEYLSTKYATMPVAPAAA